MLIIRMRFAAYSFAGPAVEQKPSRRIPRSGRDSGRVVGNPEIASRHPQIEKLADRSSYRKLGAEKTNKKRTLTIWAVIDS
jgi:hypothetical protein